MSVVICVIMFHCHVEFDLAVGLTGRQVLLVKLHVLCQMFKYFSVSV